MKVTTIRSLASQLGVSYWQIRYAMLRGYVPVNRPGRHRKLYLKPSEVQAFKEFFGDVETNRDVINQ